MIRLSDSGKVLNQTIKLNTGADFPIVGYGTYLVTGQETIYNALDAALGAGYRLIDTAAVYRNEKDIGLALKTLLPKYNLKREDVFITSKLAPSDQKGDPKRIEEAVQKSLTNLGVDYLDLYLIHWPGSASVEASDPKNQAHRAAAWQTLSKIYDSGKGPLKAIGVSNFLPRHLREILKDPNQVVPALNQVEFHPHFQQSEELFELCEKHRIVLQAYGSLGGSSNKEVMTDPVVNAIAKKLNMSPVQVLLRWALQRGYAIIPKSLTAERIKANTQLDTPLSESDMKAIADLNQGKRYSWNPETIA